MTIRSLVTAAAISAAAVAMGSSASANVTFGPGGWVNQNGATVSDPAFIASIHDIAGGVSFAVELAAGSMKTGDILLIGLEVFSTAAKALENATFSNFMSNVTGSSITGTCDDANTCGGGGGFNGGIFAGNPPEFIFDKIVRIGSQGSSDGLNTKVSFDIKGVLGLTSLDFSHVGLRLQTVGDFPDGGGGSLQIINDKPAVIPLPATGFLLLAGIGGLAAARRMKKAA